MPTPTVSGPSRNEDRFQGKGLGADTQVYRVVYHCNLIDPDRSIEKVKRKGNEIVGVVYVVTDDLTEEKAFEISKFLGTENVDEISFRQRVNEKYETIIIYMIS